jgi:hypothetical protein
MHGVRSTTWHNVHKRNLSLPESGRGAVHLGEATPYAGADCTNDGQQHDQRQFKNRARGEGRTVPVPPELTALLREHITEFGTGADGRLFPGERAAKAPQAHLHADVAGGPATRVRARGCRYASRCHALHTSSRLVSTWLNGGVPAP